MPWARLDDQFHGHMKAKLAWRTPRALGLHLLAMSYCAGLVTDGFVDDLFVEEKLPSKAERTKTCGALVDAGLWTKVEGGYVIHDWLHYNPSKEKVEERRRKDRERKGGVSDSAGIPHGIGAESDGIPFGIHSEPPRPRTGGPGLGWAGTGEEPQTATENARAPHALPESLSAVVAIAEQASKDDPTITYLDMSILSAINARPDVDHVQCAHLAVGDMLSGRRSSRHFHKVFADQCQDWEDGKARNAEHAAGIRKAFGDKPAQDFSRFNRAAGL